MIKKSARADFCIMAMSFAHERQEPDYDYDNSNDNPYVLGACFSIRHRAYFEQPVTIKPNSDKGQETAGPVSLPTSGIRDNYRRGTAGDFLRSKIATDSRLSVVSAYFTIYAFDETVGCIGVIAGQFSSGVPMIALKDAQICKKAKVAGK